MPSVSLVICTFERPAMLAAALASVARLAPAAGTALDVVVVDNSDGGSARAAVEAAARRSPVPISYVEAHPPNISVARNAGVAAARGEVVAFVDDDQELSTGWLAAVAEGLERFPHDAFFGPIAPRFEDPAAATPAARAMFSRQGELPAGADLLAHGPGRQPFVLSTANSVFRRGRTLCGPEPFDPRLGQCGGEDLLLLCRLQRDGHRFGWLPAAGASDFVPVRRCGTRYLMARHYAGGQAFAAALTWTSPRPLLDRAAITAKAALQLAFAPAWLLAAVLSRSRRDAVPAAAMRVAGVLGKGFRRRLHPLYREEHRARLGAAAR